MAITSQVTDAPRRVRYTALMSTFAQTLKTWRQARRFSQLDLAHRAEVSSRHLSFLETGRSKPSRDMIARLSEALQLPLAARNQLLSLAGFAARYRRRDWQDEEMAPIRAAVDYMLDRHAPFPAFAADRHWTILSLNAPARSLFALTGLSEGGSLIDTLLDPRSQAAIENWADIAHHAAHRLRTESAASGGDAYLDQAAAALSAVPAPEPQPTGPVLATRYRLGDIRLSLFSTIAQFGTAEDLTLDDLKIELFFPADASSDALLRSMASVD